MQMPAGSFNPQMTSDDMARASFVTRLYGTHNNRGPYLYPRSPYALQSLGDIVPMAAMQPIDDDTLFAQLPAQGTLATSVAPLGSAGFPTFQAASPATQGTVLGPSGSTVPSLTSPSSNQGASPVSTTAAAAVTGVPSAPSYTSPYGNPAANGAQGGTPAWNPDQAAQSGQPTGPITYTNPWPSIISPPPVASAPVQQTSALCEFGAWVNQNPLLAALGTLGVYLLLKGGKRK